MVSILWVLIASSVVVTSTVATFFFLVLTFFLLLLFATDFGVADERASTLKLWLVNDAPYEIMIGIRDIL